MEIRPKFLPALVSCAALLAGGAEAARPVRLTQACGLDHLESIVVSGPIASIRAVIERLEGNDHGFQQRLWRPQLHIDPRRLGPENGYFYMYYPALQDLREIHAEVSPELAAAGVQAFAVKPSYVYGLLPPWTARTVREWYHAGQDRYFLASSEEDGQTLASGGAGPGWERTGEMFDTHAEKYFAVIMDEVKVARFHRVPGEGPSNHVFTADANECGDLRRDGRWSFEGFAFYARPVASRRAVPDACGMTWTPYRPVYRLYNGRRESPGYRHVTRLALYEQMQERGWEGQGAAFCVPHR